MYVTRMGECWDEAAKAVYGNEKYIGYLMQNNMSLLDIAVFSAGAILNTRRFPGRKKICRHGEGDHE